MSNIHVNRPILKAQAFCSRKGCPNRVRRAGRRYCSLACKGLAQRVAPGTYTDLSDQEQRDAALREAHRRKAAHEPVEAWPEPVRSVYHLYERARLHPQRSGSH